MTILEIARTFSKLIREGKIAPPARTLRFLWPMEVEGSMAMLNAHPAWAANHVKARPTRNRWTLGMAKFSCGLSPRHLG